MKTKLIRLLIIVASLLFISAIVIFCLVWNGVIILNGFSAEKYPVKGVDISSYQGEINWEILSEQNISFAFIKATEGSTLVDKNFAYNFEEAKKTSIPVGAYHFFSYDSKGETQAENFINTVEPYEGMLPPVIDVEFYADKEKNPPEREYVTEQLKTMLDILEKHYNQKPIIYATEKSYKLYLSNDYEDYDIWIRNVLTEPTLSDGRSWTFWQYTNRDRLEGYSGVEKYIDVNVFCGSIEEFEEYLASDTYKN